MKSSRDERSPYAEDHEYLAELDRPAPMAGLMLKMVDYLDVETRQKDLRSLDYRAEYLASEHWKATRRAALRRVGYCCQHCGLRVEPDQRWRLDVHHLTYARLGAELDTDLEVICRACHQKEHAA